MITHTTPTTPVRRKMPWALIWLLAAAIVVAIAVSAFVAMTGDSTPTVTFDGQTVVYDGPATFEAGEHTFVFDGSAYEPDFVFALIGVTDPTISDADIATYFPVEVTSETPAPFLDGLRGKLFYVTEDATDARILEETFLLDADVRYGVFVFTSRQDTDQQFFAATFEVE